MQKLRLNLDALTVESFDTVGGDAARRGTVPAHAMNSELNCMPTERGCEAAGSDTCATQATACGTCATCWATNCGATACGSCNGATCVYTYCGTCDTRCASAEPYVC
jgi:hypothetical protein